MIREAPEKDLLRKRRDRQRRHGKNHQREGFTAQLLRKLVRDQYLYAQTRDNGRVHGYREIRGDDADDPNNHCLQGPDPSEAQLPPRTAASADGEIPDAPEHGGLQHSGRKQGNDCRYRVAHIPRRNESPNRHQHHREYPHDQPN